MATGCTYRAVERIPALSVNGENQRVLCSRTNFSPLHLSKATKRRSARRHGATDTRSRPRFILPEAHHEMHPFICVALSGFTRFGRHSAPDRWFKAGGLAQTRKRRLVGKGCEWKSDHRGR